MQGFSPVASNKLYIQIYNQLHDAIISGRFQVGDKLPSEKELLNGLVDSIQGGGVYVKAQQSEEELPQVIEPQEIIRARMVLEPDIAREAALHLDEENRRVLEELLEKFHAESKVGVITKETDRAFHLALAKETDRAFHLALAKASGSTMYVMIMDLVFKAMEQELWELILSRTIATQRYQDQNNMEHIRICEAILDGRADDANEFMKSHMAMLYERYWSE